MAALPVLRRDHRAPGAGRPGLLMHEERVDGGATDGRYWACVPDYGLPRFTPFDHRLDDGVAGPVQGEKRQPQFAPDVARRIVSHRWQCRHSHQIRNVMKERITQSLTISLHSDPSCGKPSC
jgi:hypothetical protein